MITYNRAQFKNLTGRVIPYKKTKINICNFVNNSYSEAVVRRKFRIFCRFQNHSVKTIHYHSDDRKPFNLLYDYYVRFKDVDY